MIAVAVFMAGPAAYAQPDYEGLDCLAPPYDTPTSERQRQAGSLVQWLRIALERYGRLGQILDDDPPEVCLAERLFGIQGYYDPEAGRIVLRDDLPIPLMRAVAIHELRHVHQAELGACPGPTLSMQATARVTLAMEADASAVTLAIAWQLRAEGQAEVWNALSDWPSQAPLARAFAAEMGGSGDLALATAAAFAAWYESEWLRESYYIAACSAYLDRQDRSHALPRYGSIGQEHLETLCRLPGGEPYPCEEPAGE